jgi:hypothetical protein
VIENDIDLVQDRADARVAEPLRRVSYVEGMLLGVEATRVEQDFHRRRLNRHRYWSGRIGCVLGLRVWLEPLSDPGAPVDADAFESGKLVLRVSPGVAYDGLGREVLLHESHCLRLAEWIAREREANALALGHDAAAGVLRLAVWIRHAACEQGQEPVLAHRLSAGTDAVEFTRIGDGVRLELRQVAASLKGRDDIGLCAWQRAVRERTLLADGAFDDWKDALTVAEHDFLAERAAAGATPEELAELGRRLRLIGAGDQLPLTSTPEPEDEELAAFARIPLAQIEIAAPGFPELRLNPDEIAIDNLVRPFALSRNHELI